MSTFYVFNIPIVDIFISIHYFPQSHYLISVFRSTILISNQWLLDVKIVYCILVIHYSIYIQLCVKSLNCLY